MNRRDEEMVGVMAGSASQGSRRVVRLTATALAAALLVSGLVAPARADEAASLADRESWSAAERRAYGESLWEDPDTENPLTATTAPESRLPDHSGEKGTTDWALARADEAPASVPETEGGEALLTVPGRGVARGRAGSLPVTVRAKGGSSGDGGAASSAGQVRVRTLDPSAAKAAAVDGLLLAVESDGASTGDGGGQERSSEESPTSTVELGIDVSDVPAATSADWLARAELVRLPACALSTPDVAKCQEREPVPGSEVDLESGVVTATVDVQTEQTRTRSTSAGQEMATVLAVEAGASGSGGDWSATPLSPSSSWQVSQQSGSFSWSYPMRTPSTPGGLEPEVSLNYDSGSLDGRVASTNNQAGQIGDGWTLNASGFVERRYVPCFDDQKERDGNAPNNASHDSSDLCWHDENATLNLGGTSSELVKDEASGTWRLENDDNTKVEHLTGAWNGDNDKEYWKVTTSDGTQYWFGRNKRSATGSNLYSAWTVPVYGNHPGEPCYDSSFGSSRCNQVWRWNLDYVVDTSGNSMTYRYGREWNRYGYNNNAGTASYVRGGSLRWIDYGTRAGDDEGAKPSARVKFTVAERCLKTSGFDCAEGKLTEANKSHWPDVPQDRICSSTTSCAGRTSPTFFSRKRTTTVTTQVLTSGEAYRQVDRWVLTQKFPDPGDGTDPALWLEQVQHVGVVGANDITLPPTKFTGEQKPNRVDAQLDDRFPMNRYRIAFIQSESGGVTEINYTGTGGCTPTSLPGSPESNGKRCMPVYWTPEGATDQVLEYFHKYLVTSVLELPQAGNSDAVETHYSYLGSPAWHYDDDELVRPKYRTWSQWRGYATVDVKVGAPETDGEPQMRTRYRYFRGMHGDRSSPSGGTRTVSVDGITDHDQFAGMLREEITYDGSTKVESTTHVPWRSSATATSSDGDKAFHTGVQETGTSTPLASGGERSIRSTTSFDSYGMPIEVSDLGDTSTSSDNLCTRTSYVRNTAKNILGTVKRTETASVGCGTAPTRPKHVVSDERFAYDGQGVGIAPTRGRLTKRQEADHYTSGSPVYVDAERTVHDSYGRVTDRYDALGRKTSTSYVTTAGLTARTTVTSPDPDGSGSLGRRTVVTELDPAWGVPTKVTDANGNVTSGSYDALGRLTQVWEPGRAKGSDSPTTKFGYQVRSTGSNAVTTETLNHDGSAYVTSSVIYDGLLRQIQAQAPSADRESPGRLVTDTLYDSRGLVEQTNAPWYTTGSVSSTLVVSSDAKPGSTFSTYDGAGRVTREEFRTGGTPKWATTTSYGGDRVTVDPPKGGTPTTTIVDARGRTSAVRQYLGGSPSGDYQTTTYQYDDADRLIGVTDPVGNDWSYGYDLRGRQMSASDPDKGTSTSTFDAAGNVVTTTDARGEKLAYTYDALGRRTSMRDDSTSGAVRAQWVYDTLAKGQLTKSVRKADGASYTLAVTGYDDHYRPLGQTVTVPSSQGALAGVVHDRVHVHAGRARRDGHAAGGRRAAGGDRYDVLRRCEPGRVDGRRVPARQLRVDQPILAVRRDGQGRHGCQLRGAGELGVREGHPSPHALVVAARGRVGVRVRHEVHVRRGRERAECGGHAAGECAGLPVFRVRRVAAVDAGVDAGVWWVCCGAVVLVDRWCGGVLVEL